MGQGMISSQMGRRFWATPENAHGSASKFPVHLLISYVA